MSGETNCMVLIRGVLPNLAGAFAEIARYFLDRPEDVLSQTISVTAGVIGVSESSIVRFCHKLGYNGFAEFKINLARNIEERKVFVLDDVTIESGEFDPILVTAKLFAQISQALNDTLRIIDPAALNRTIDLVGAAGHILFLGIGASAPVAIDANRRFMRLGLPVSAAVDPYEMLIAANNLSRDGVVLAISHTGHSIETIRAMQKARERGILTICITSFFDSPITKYSDVALVTSAYENEVLKESLTSRLAHLAILDSIYTNIALRTYSDASAKIRDVDGMINGVHKKHRGN